MDDRHAEHIERILGIRKGDLNPVVFDMRVDYDHPVFTEFANELIDHDMLRLPYEQCVFLHRPKDLPAALVIYAWEGDDVISVIALSGVHGEPISGFEFLLQEKKIRECSFGDSSIAISLIDAAAIDGEYGAVAQYVFAVLARYIAALATRGIQERIEVPSRKLNERRAKRGDRKLPERHVIYISTEAARSPGCVGDKERASPRPHWRRGHIRRLSSGTLVAVSPCIVAGEIASRKSYVVN